MSYNLSTMPGCSGNYNRPIEAWIWKGLTCKECTWEQFCKEYYQERNMNSNIPRKDHNIQVENTAINLQ